MIKLETRGICKEYDDARIIEDINVQVNNEEIVALLGVSGVGKTTLFNIVSGVESPTKGQVFLKGEDITGKTGRISYMQQKDLLMPYKTILDNVTLPMLIRGYRKKEAREAASDYFRVFGLEGTQGKYPIQLSGGMKQRAAFLRSYLFSKEMMLLDEPFSALDTITKSSMHSWYLRIMSHVKSSTLFITHDIDEAIYLSDRIYILTGRPGKVTKEIIIDSKRERAEDFTTSDTFIHYKKVILAHIKETGYPYD
ncbi:MAG: transporter ATP-binding protein [Clostridia bacterium]|jgi:ABC-type nitrate/sulfonate/bicarbonate transport system ATPase subunit|nr:transporter ATP-binding protein [Clostridia bacterium]